MSDKDLYHHPIPPPFGWVLAEESRGELPSGNPSSQMSTITLDSQLVNSVAGGKNAPRRNPSVVHRPNQRKPSTAASVPSPPTAPFRSDKQMMGTGVYPIEKRGIQDYDCSTLAPPMRPPRNPASSLVKTLEECTPMFAPGQTTAPLRSSRQPVLVEQQANQQSGTEGNSQSSGEQFLDEAFHDVELDVEAPSAGDRRVGYNGTTIKVEKKEVMKKEVTQSNNVQHNNTNLKMACYCWILCLGLVIAGALAYYFFILSNQNDDTQSTSPGQQVWGPRSEQIQRSLPGKFNAMGESMRWLVNDDTWIPPSGVEDVDSYWRERYALAELYRSTNGETWSFEHNWRSPDSVCDWSCCTQDIYSVECDDAGRVTAISFGALFPRDYFNLEGTLPVDIFESMTKLRHLNLDNNRLAGALPKLPDSIEHFGASNNRFSGTIEKSHVESLSQLTYLNLSQNLFSGSLPRLPSSIEKFYAFQDPDKGRNHEGFSGSIPREYFRSLTKLTILNLHDNALVGSIPSLPSGLRQLELHGNYFTGSLPALPATVEDVLLHNNQIGGTLKVDYFYGLLNINRFFVASNRMRGPIPPLPPSLKHAWFQDNCFTDVSNAAQRFDVSGNGEAEYCNGP